MNMRNGCCEPISQDQALAWVADVFQLSPGEVTPSTPREAIPLWDSLGVLTLMAELDEKFDVVLTDQELRAMNKVEDILVVLRSKGKISS